jgi:hypothetical protein
MTLLAFACARTDSRAPLAAASPGAAPGPATAIFAAG